MSTPGPDDPVGGRPRDRRIDHALLETTLEMLTTEGYASLSLEQIARRAGTSRPAIYRRFHGRAPLVLAAIATRLDLPAPPDTGCTLCDIDEGFRVFLTAYRTIPPETLNALYAECATDPSLRTRYAETVIRPSRAIVGATIERAVARGDLRADVDVDQLLDMISSFMLHRAAFGRHHLSAEEAQGAIELLLRGAAVDYQALLAHSQTVDADSARHDEHAH